MCCTVVTILDVDKYIKTFCFLLGSEGHKETPWSRDHLAHALSEWLHNFVIAYDPFLHSCLQYTRKYYRDQLHDRILHALSFKMTPKLLWITSFLRHPATANLQIYTEISQKKQKQNKRGPCTCKLQWKFTYHRPVCPQYHPDKNRYLQKIKLR